jgi:IclR family acetate operon transcriptional repressor
MAVVQEGRRKEAGRGEVQSLVRALSIVNRLADAEEGIRLTDLARQVGLAPSTAHRLLTTLEQERYVRFDTGRRVWSVGVQAFVSGIAFARTRRLVRIARPTMQALMEATGETVNLAVEEEGQAIYLGQVESHQTTPAFSRPGGRVGLHCSAVGKAMLSAMSEAQVMRIVGRHGLTRLTSSTIGRIGDLAEGLRQARERGFAVDDEEQATGIRCVAAVIFNEFMEPAAALSVSAPALRLRDGRIAEIGALVQRTANAVTIKFGGRLPAEWGRPERRAG